MERLKSQIKDSCLQATKHNIKKINQTYLFVQGANENIWMQISKTDTYKNREEKLIVTSIQRWNVLSEKAAEFNRLNQLCLLEI